MPAIYLAQPVWSVEEDGGFVSWVPPKNTIGWFDLRSLPQCGTPGPIRQGYGLMLLSRKAPVGYYLGDNLKAVMDSTRKRDVKAALGLGEDIVADDVLGMLIELLTRHADPTGQARWKPLRGTKRLGARLNLGGWQVWSSGFDSVIEANTIAVFQADYRRNKTEGESAKVLKRWTGAEIRKVFGRMSDELAAQILPPEYDKDGWEPPKTSVSDDFNRGNEELGASANWTEVNGDLEVISNEVGPGATGSAFNARFGTVLSSDEQFAEIDFTTAANGSSFVGPATRFAAAAETFYFYRQTEGGAISLVRRVTGSNTTDASDTNAITLPVTVRGKVDGSDLLDLLIDTVSKLTFTDNTITGNLRTGLIFRAIATDERGDNWSAADLAVVTRRVFVVS